MEVPSSKKIKSVVTVKPEENMKKYLSKVNEDPEHKRTMLSGPAMYSEDLKHINPKNPKAVDWKKNGVVPKRGNALANYQTSAVAKAMAAEERECEAKPDAEEAFDGFLNLT